VVLIHGWPLSAQAWEPQVSVLRTVGCCVVDYDRRAFGRSDKPESGYRYDALADDLQRVMDQCELQPASIDRLQRVPSWATSDQERTVNMRSREPQSHCRSQFFKIK
jgi:alpha-beta hydrolase superfamily lysophospholipase